VSTAEKVQDLKKLTIMNGMLSEIHIKNLTMYAHIVLDNPKPVDLLIELNYDVEAKFQDPDGKKKGGYVEYNYKCSGELIVDDNFLPLLERSVHGLLWPEVDIRLLFNGEKFWSSNESKNRKPASAPSAPVAKDGSSSRKVKRIIATSTAEGV